MLSNYIPSSDISTDALATSKIKKKNLLKKKINVDFNKSCVPEIQNKSAEKENGFVDPFQRILDEKILTFAITSSSFPQEVFTREYVKEMIETLQYLKSQVPGGERILRFIYMIFEAGYCKVKVGDLFTKKWIIEKISTLTYHDIPLMATPIKRLPICRCKTTIPGQILDNATIFSRINHQNKSVSTSVWNILNKTQSENDFAAFFEVDALSAHGIQTLNRMINFGGVQIQFEFEQMFDQVADDQE